MEDNEKLTEEQLRRIARAKELMATEMEFAERFYQQLLVCLTAMLSIGVALKPDKAPSDLYMWLYNSGSLLQVLCMICLIVLMKEPLSIFRRTDVEYNKIVSDFLHQKRNDTNCFVNPSKLFLFCETIYLYLFVACVLVVALMGVFR
jgi:predicted house-cleaning NTP pyrophosphatase (Maf/HAM1 superfamily)